MNKYEVFNLYNVIKQHFSTDYDYFKYNGKMNLNQKSLRKRKDWFRFERMAGKYSSEHELKKLFVYNCLNYDYYKFEETDGFYEWKKRIESFEYYIEQELYLFEYDIIDSIKRYRNQYPLLLTHYLRKENSIELILSLNECFDFLNVWDKKITDKLLWPREYNKFKKYRKFFKEFTNFNKQNFITILKQQRKKECQLA